LLKSELIQRTIGLNPTLSESVCRTLVEKFFDAITDRLVNGGGDIELRGFGRFFLSRVERIEAVADGGYIDRGHRGLRSGWGHRLCARAIRSPAVREGFFGKSVFRYEPDRDVFVCPAGAALSPCYRGKFARQCDGRLCQPRCLQSMLAEITLHSVIPPRLAPGERGRSRPHGGAVGTAPRCARLTAKQRRASLRHHQAVDGPGHLPDAPAASSA
jgi:hypothetical protein